MRNSTLTSNKSFIIGDKQIIDFPTKKYDVIYADPPWQYKDKAHDGKRGVQYQYETLSINELMQLPVSSIANTNCVLFMWVTAPLLLDALRLAQAWGFTYKTKGFCWHKVNKDGSSFRGMGHYTRSNTEDVLVFTKGRCLNRTDKGVFQVVTEARREHSRKPDEVRERLSKLYANASRIELFARNKTQNWDVWGNQINKYTGS